LRLNNSELAQSESASQPQQEMSLTLIRLSNWIVSRHRMIERLKTMAKLAAGWDRNKI
jgi:hypothetical protein